ncbi:hypothetical protein BCR42DRAFT_176752 [Absidia repens]|uniref:Alpha/Beta hydrolase protein n=1 Tax=Absidia repens TaxID=90262 RepID=A0A1X2HZF4_9FUNG|nr:hypothetical protein BCR42DRAFT_176752 [Absidia repens]
MSIPAQSIQHLGRIPFFHHKTTSSLTLCFIPGFRSSFQASLKSDHLFRWSQQHNIGFLTWDHDEETSIQDWCQQGQDIIISQLLSPLTKQTTQNDTRPSKQRILFVGASLGTWLAIRIAHGLMIHDNNSKALTVQGLIGIGGAADTTEKWLQELQDNNATATQILLEGGSIWRRPSKYATHGYYDIPISFLEASRPSLLFTQNNDIAEIPYPVHLIHGALDHDVTLASAQRLLAWIRFRQSSSLITPATADLHLVKDGDHRLSRPQDLGLLDKVLITCTEDGY